MIWYDPWLIGSYIRKTVCFQNAPLLICVTYGGMEDEDFELSCVDLHVYKHSNCFIKLYTELLFQVSKASWIADSYQNEILVELTSLISENFVSSVS